MFARGWYWHTVHVSTILKLFLNQKATLDATKQSFNSWYREPCSHSFFHYDCPLDFLTTRKNWGKKFEPPNIGPKSQAKQSRGRKKRAPFLARSFITPHAGSWKRKRSSLHFGSSWNRWNLWHLWVNLRRANFQISTPPTERRPRKKGMNYALIKCKAGYFLSGIRMMMDVLTAQRVTFRYEQRKRYRVLRKATSQNDPKWFLDVTGTGCARGFDGRSTLQGLSTNHREIKGRFMPDLWRVPRSLIPMLTLQPSQLSNEKRAPGCLGYIQRG